MSKTNSVVEVNGNRYDAISGELISKVKKASNHIHRPRGKKMVDGFVLSSARRPATTNAQVSKSASRPKTTAHGLHTRTQHSKTLMRKVVKKPSFSKAEPTQKKPVHAQSHGVNPIRESRAKTVIKHAKVNRFGALQSSATSTAKADVMPHKPRLKNTSAAIEIVAPRAPSMVTSVSHQKLERLLDEALLKADAHKQMMHHNQSSRLSRMKRLPRWLSIGFAILILTILAAAVIWRNLPSVAMHVAAARAHVKASIPSYTPSGYGFTNHIKYKTGSVTLQYIDKTSGEPGFALTQQTSDWDSASLAANALPKDVPVQTSQVNGTTVYVYGTSNDAAWVNHGVLYNLKNKGSLTSDQVMKIVEAL
ncbi:DUF4367 domain-containing protein [Candidatus Saccharibacteria bacterium]|nr:DUF4367 domain-containing protein [Candidatus Saccharibacteria bacterium]